MFKQMVDTLADNSQPNQHAPNVTQNPADNIVEDMASQLESLLRAGKRVLYMLSGGSSIGVAVKVLGQLNTPATSGLTLALTDERFGPLDHPDSNWKQLRDAGLAMHQATIVPVLEASDKQIDTTTERYDARLQEALMSSDYVIALFGIGADGHTAGLLPKAPVLSSTRLADQYVAPDFPRITVTPRFLRYVDTAYIYANNPDKKQALADFLEEGSVSDAPARAIKQAQSIRLYSNYQPDKQEA